MNHIEIHPMSVLLGVVMASCAALLSGFAGARHVAGEGGIHHITAEHLAILNHMSIVQLPDGKGRLNETIRISQANLQVVNGLGDTETKNGLGNVIVGYNESGNFFGDDRTGSHTVVLGSENSYSSYGGLIGGFENTVSGQYASITGGIDNVAAGNFSSISGGALNRALGRQSSVSAGADNTAAGDFSSISGGQKNEANGSFASVSGGRENTAGGVESSVSGGTNRSVTGPFDWRAGSLFEDD